MSTMVVQICREKAETVRMVTQDAQAFQEAHCVQSILTALFLSRNACTMGLPRYYVQWLPFSIVGSGSGVFPAHFIDCFSLSKVRRTFLRYVQLKQSKFIVKVGQAFPSFNGLMNSLMEN